MIYMVEVGGPTKQSPPKMGAKEGSEEEEENWDDWLTKSH